MVCLVHGHGVCTEHGLLQKVFSLLQRAFGLRLTAANRGQPQLFDFLKQRIAGLLAQDLAQQHAERANIAAQRRFFQVSRARLKFGKALGPAIRLPEGWHHYRLCIDAQSLPQAAPTRLAVPGAVPSAFPTRLSAKYAFHAVRRAPVRHGPSLLRSRRYRETARRCRSKLRRGEFLLRRI